jgi:hypothetical protein
MVFSPLFWSEFGAKMTVVGLAQVCAIVSVCNIAVKAVMDTTDTMDAMDAMEQRRNSDGRDGHDGTGAEDGGGGDESSIGHWTYCNLIVSKNVIFFWCEQV